VYYGQALLDDAGDLLSRVDAYEMALDWLEEIAM
jgi:hypothetical protein